MSVLVFLTGFVEFAKNLTDLSGALRAGKVRRNNAAAAYFEQLGDAMEKVVGGLRANEAPRISGHEMQTLIHAFPEKTKKVFGAQESAERRASLELAALTAKTLDGWVLFNRPNVPAEREEMFALLERIAGDCRGLAGVLKSPT